MRNIIATLLFTTKHVIIGERDNIIEVLSIGKIFFFTIFLIIEAILSGISAQTSNPVIAVHFIAAIAWVFLLISLLYWRWISLFDRNPQKFRYILFNFPRCEIGPTFRIDFDNDKIPGNTFRSVVMTVNLAIVTFSLPLMIFPFLFYLDEQILQINMSYFKENIKILHIHIPIIDVIFIYLTCWDTTVFRFFGSDSDLSKLYPAILLVCKYASLVSLFPLRALFNSDGKRGRARE